MTVSKYSILCCIFIVIFWTASHIATAPKQQDYFKYIYLKLNISVECGIAHFKRA